MLEHAAPVTPDLDDTSVLGLASISRELSANDVGVDPVAHLGPVGSLNVELALPAPFDLAAAGITGAAATSGSTPPGTTPAGSADGDTTGTGSSSAPILVGAGAVAVGALAAGTVALRRRGTVSDDPSPPPA